MTATEPLLDEPWSLERTRNLLLRADAPTWPDAQILVFDTVVASQTAATWLPPALRASVPAAATIFVADYPTTSFGVAYRECGVLLHATLRGTPVVHCAWMVVDSDTAMILGRELLGFPKKLARIELLADGNRISARVVRRDVELLNIAAELGESLPQTKAFPLPIVNVRGNPDLLPPVLWKMTVPERFHTGRRAHLRVSVGKSPYDPLSQLQLPPAMDGSCLRVDLGVPPPDAGLIPRGVMPAGIVSPLWFARRFPFTVF